MFRSPQLVLASEVIHMNRKHKVSVFSSTFAVVALLSFALAVAVPACAAAPTAASYNDYCLDGLSGGPLAVLVIERAPGGGSDTERIASASNYIGDDFSAQAVRHIYDERGRWVAVIRPLPADAVDEDGPVVRVVYDTQDREVARLESWYDDECRLIRERRWEAGVLVSEWESSYSEDGATEISRRLIPQGEPITVTRTRDDLGLVIAETYDDPARGVTLYVHEYDTDDFYNWTVRRTRVVGSPPEDVTVTRRIIQYRTYT